MKTYSLLLAVLVAAGVLTGCTSGNKPTAPDAATTSKGDDTQNPDAATSKEPEPDYFKRDLDLNIKEGNEALNNKDYDRSERILLAALRQCDLYPKQEARQAAILNNLAAIYEEKEMYTQAVPLLNKAQKLFIRAFGRKNQAVYITLGNLGRVLAKQYRWEEAANVYQTAVGLMEEDSKAASSEAYKDMLMKCSEAWEKAGNAFKANKIDAKIKAFKSAAK